MKALITATVQFGPFTSIETLEDRYKCDNAVEYQFSVIGPATIGDYIPPPPPPPTSAQINAPILAKMATLEASVTPRRLREAIRGAGKIWLDTVDDQITALRITLIP